MSIFRHIFAAATNFIRIASLSFREIQNKFTRDCSFVGSEDLAGEAFRSDCWISECFSCNTGMTCVKFSLPHEASILLYKN